MTSKIYIGVIWSATLGLAYFVGFMDRDSSSTLVDSGQGSELGTSYRYVEGASGKGSSTKGLDVSSALGASKESELDEGDASVQAGELRVSEYLLELASDEEGKPATAEEIREILGAALTSDNLVIRNRAIADMLSRLTADNATVALRVFENTPRAYHTDNNFRLYFEYVPFF